MDRLYVGRDTTTSELRRLDRLSHVLDSAVTIPGTRWRIGVDGFLGLIPGVGDSIGAALSTYIIFQAARLGASKVTLLRMLGNVATETVVGVVPIVGDIFDIAWKANLRNVTLLHGERLDHRERTAPQVARLFLLLSLVVIFGLIGASIFLAWWLLRTLVG